MVNADPRELREVLTNLIHNALDAMEGGGKLRLATNLESEFGVLICGDDGAGIPDEVKERIFAKIRSFTSSGIPAPSSPQINTPNSDSRLVARRSLPPPSMASKAL